MSTSHHEPTAPPKLGIFGTLRQILMILLGMVLMSSAASLIVRAYNKPAVAADAVVQARLERLAAKRAESAQADAYGWIDKNAGTVSLPVARAMELTASELKAKPVRRTEETPPPPVPTAPPTN